jgi:1-acyl-sn-glycerol-3-phosphate acyltransferase
MEEKTIEKAPDRLEVLKKIEEYEKKGLFDVDVENDLPTKELLPNQIDYLRKKLTSKIKRKFAYSMARKFMNKLIKDKILRIKEINGIQNWQNVKGGAIITCNHFNALDSFAMQITYEKTNPKRKKMYKVIREGNYTNFPGFFGMIFKNCNTLPLSSNKQTMKKFLSAVETILKHGDYILVYPEQSMWWNYKKPKPLKNGAFKFAVENDVPVVPCFITMNDSGDIGPDGFYIQEYTINVFEPLYANKNLSKKDQIQDLLDRNFECWKNCYENTYNKKLEYTTK